MIDASVTKLCTGCGTVGAAGDFYVRASGTLYSRCRRCVREANASLKRERLAARRAALEPWQVAHLERVRREKEARLRTRARGIRSTEPEPSRAAPVPAHRPAQKIGPTEKAGVVARIQRLTAAMQEANREEQDALEEMIQDLWPFSGDKTCSACACVVSPSKMRPPSRLNGLDGQCNACADAQSEARSLLIFGPWPGPRLLRMRDGTAIPLIEFVRRHRARESALPPQQRRWSD